MPCMRLLVFKQILYLKCNNLCTHFELKSLNSVSTFSLFSQLKKSTQAAEEPIIFEYFRSRDIFRADWYRVLTRTGDKHENTS